MELDSWQFQQTIDKIADAIKNTNHSFNFGYIPPLQINHKGEINNIETKDDARSEIEKTRCVIETLLSAVGEKEAKAALEGRYSALNNALKRAYVLLKKQIDDEIRKYEENTPPI